MKKNKVIYVITLIDTENVEYRADGSSYKFADSRPLGYQRSFKDAEELLVKNGASLWEGRYNYAVIESVPEGLYPVYESRGYKDHWYKMDKKKNTYVKSKTFEENDKDLGKIKTVGWCFS